MIVKELHGSGTVVRIHDDFFEDIPQLRIDRVAKITSDSYKRRHLEKKTNQGNIHSRTVTLPQFGG